ncbi:MAG: hypothetical protein QM763_09520 [Agriterribacter sp.]
MPEETFIEKITINEIAGKYAAIHAYDGMIWKVRSGFLTLVFAGWSLIIKTAIDNKLNLEDILQYVFILSGFSLALAMGGYKVDINYVKRKFRVINGVNELIEIAYSTNINIQSEQKELVELLKILGDVHNNKYISRAYTNEINVSRLIYIIPSLLVICIVLYYRIKY